MTFYAFYLFYLFLRHLFVCFYLVIFKLTNANHVTDSIIFLCFSRAIQAMGEN